jgi:hypothetical protein
MALNLTPKEFAAKYNFFNTRAFEETTDNVSKLKAKLPTTGITDELVAKFKLDVNMEIRKLLLAVDPFLINLDSSKVDTKDGLQTFMQDASSFSEGNRTFIIDLRNYFKETLKSKGKYEIIGFSPDNSVLATLTISQLETLNKEETVWINANKMSAGKEDKINKLEYFASQRRSIISNAGPIGSLLSLSFAQLPKKTKSDFLNEKMQSNKRMLARQKLVEARRRELIAIFEKEGPKFDFSSHLPK